MLFRSRINLGKPWSVRLTEGLGRTRAERNRLLSWLEAVRLVATDVTWLLGKTNPLDRTCIQLPLLNLLAGASKRLLLVWRPCEQLPILAAARVGATAIVVLHFTTTRRLPCTGTDSQSSDYPARGAIN